MLFYSESNVVSSFFFSTLSSIGTMHGSFENTPNALAFNNWLDTLNPLKLSTFHNKPNASNTLDASTFHNGCGLLSYYVSKPSNGALVHLKMSSVIWIILGIKVN
jgi:hypothetical protein